MEWFAMAPFGIPLTIPILAAFYLLAVYLLLMVVQRSQPWSLCPWLFRFSHNSLTMLRKNSETLWTLPPRRKRRVF